MARTEVILIRHGETVWNLEGRYQGQLDSPLTERGVHQAEAIAARLRDCPFDHLYASDLGRTWKTAEPIAAATGHPILPEPRLRERHFGIFHGLDRTTIRDRYPEAHRGYTSDDPDYPVPQGESLRQLHERAVSCLEELAARHAGQRLVLVSHGGALAALLRHVIGIPIAAPRPFKLFNAAFNLITRSGDGWQIEVLGDACHLRHLDTDDDIVR